MAKVPGRRAKATAFAVAGQAAMPWARAGSGLRETISPRSVTVATP